MRLIVTYDNPHYGEHEEYASSLSDLADGFNGTLDTAALVARLKVAGIAIIENGYATTTVVREADADDQRAIDTALADAQAESL